MPRKTKEQLRPEVWDYLYNRAKYDAVSMKDLVRKFGINEVFLYRTCDHPWFYMPSANYVRIARRE